ncbi:MAG TPA: CRISPR-associated endonuclease Cas2 [Bryobacteraceae bacterium]|nr:CRISPR-associated endonuclease Cas2 [Bryobacteraceae bacterium]
MVLVIAYDVCTETKDGRRRLRRVAQACKDYGQRVQKSIFECVIGEREWVLLRARLLSEYSGTEDSLRFYFLDQVSRDRTEHHGVGRPVDLDGPLVI